MSTPSPAPAGLHEHGSFQRFGRSLMTRIGNNVTLKSHDPALPGSMPGEGISKDAAGQDIESGLYNNGVNIHQGLVPANDQLALFRSLVGIDNAPALHHTSFFHRRRPAQNIGIYGRVVYAEAKAHRSYKTYSVAITLSLGLQLVAAAALTALGAADGSNKAITAFGAINTVIAGFLAYLKGSGLPGRLKYFESEWTKLREYIEQRERDFCREKPMIDLEAEVELIEQMYEQVKGDIEANTPDSFVSKTESSRRHNTSTPIPGFAGSSAVNTGDKLAEHRSVMAMRRTTSSNSLPLTEKSGMQPVVSVPRRSGFSTVTTETRPQPQPQPQLQPDRISAVGQPGNGPSEFSGNVTSL